MMIFVKLCLIYIFNTNDHSKKDTTKYVAYQFCALFGLCFVIITCVYQNNQIGTRCPACNQTITPANDLMEIIIELRSNLTRRTSNSLCSSSRQSKSISMYDSSIIASLSIVFGMLLDKTASKSITKWLVTIDTIPWPDLKFKYKIILKRHNIFFLLYWGVQGSDLCVNQKFKSFFVRDFDFKTYAQVWLGLHLFKS
ncbi:hypothetical protein BpHYR1_030582 [Brachionus plicatilis]|uniref:LITAF domain-containing protein n=1 Tax=Brachionus plicatilis TaxID=10195 RepID=A0A3M7P953_BRAPC|nr:hypothetical protein BpHYR1_030582 [Brachionus plicatilis]